MSILSLLSPDKLALCVSSGDVKTITKAQGVGPKLAQRVVLELKGRLSSQLSPPSAAAAEGIAAAASSGSAAEAIEALVMLGYSRSEAAAGISKLDSSLPVEELVRLALKSLI